MGDRVTGLAVGLDKRSNRACEAGFQEYTVLKADLTSTIPHSMPYENACVLGLGLGTAACGLFQKDFLALPLPTGLPTPTGETLLVWGGSTSVGCNAIQLAVAAGYEVISTASPKNHAYLKKLGATKAFDYNSPTVVQDIISAFKNRTTAGAISIGKGSFTKCVEILGSCKGKKFIAQATMDTPESGFPKGALEFPPFMLRFAYTMISGTVKAKRNGVSYKMIYGFELAANEVGRAIFEDFLPRALAEGTFVPAPEPQVVGKGLEKLQEAMEISRKGVSAKKIVVTL